MQELNFSGHNLSVDLKEVKSMFRDELNNDCRYMVKRAFEKIIKCKVMGIFKAQKAVRKSL